MDLACIKGNMVDSINRTIIPVTMNFQFGKIVSIQATESSNIDPALPFIIPGFIDAHVHIESSMLIPSEFARLAVVHGTVATVSDPHEIANVCGMEGVQFMIEDGKKVPFKFYFGAPSCVPATTFETAGDELNSEQVKTLLELPDVKYLSEMMNFPGAIAGEEEVLKKIAAAHALGKPVDGHAPALSGEGLVQYINRGISTDHECFTLEEAKEKLSHGMKIIIREGSAAKNFEALIPLIDELGAIDAQIKALTKTSDALKASLKALGEGDYIGASYKCLVYGSKGRDITDWKTIAEQFNPSYQLITAHTTKGLPSLTAKPSKI